MLDEIPIYKSIINHLESGYDCNIPQGEGTTPPSPIFTSIKLNCLIS